MIYLVIDVLKKFVRIFGLAGLFRMQAEENPHQTINLNVNSHSLTPQIVNEQENPEAMQYLIHTGSN